MLHVISSPGSPIDKEEADAAKKKKKKDFVFHPPALLRDLAQRLIACPRSSSCKLGTYIDGVTRRW